jgi:predicted membrane protein
LRKIISYFAGMNKLRSFFSLNPYYFTGLLLFFAVGFFFSSHNNRSEGFLYLTAYHSIFLDNFFIYYTNLGDGFFTVAVPSFFLCMANPGGIFDFRAFGSGIKKSYIQPKANGVF